MKKSRTRNYLVLILLVAIAITCTLAAASVAFAGDINSEESRLISSISGATFEYEGDKYVATAYGIGQLEETLAADDIDLTAEQVDNALSMVYSNVQTGIADGYIAKAGEDASKAAAEKEKANTAKNGKSIFEEKVIGQDPVIKNTGFDFDIIPILVGLLVLVVIAAGFIKGKSKIFRRLLGIGIMAMLMGLVIGISEPILDLFQLQFTAQAIMGDPEKTFVCEDVDATYPDNGMKYGQIACEEMGLSTPLYYGDTEAIFEKGAGQYSGNEVSSGIPGEGKAIIVGGHDLTFFAPLADAKRGQIIEITTSYGEFSYEITDTKIANYDDTSAYTGFDDETLVMYTCYPMGQVFGARNERLFVYAKKVTGPVIGKVAADE